MPTLLRLCLAATCLLPTARARAGPVRAGVQEYYVIGQTDQFFEMLQLISDDDNAPPLPYPGLNAAPDEPGLNTVTSLTASTEGQVIIYDHWEDGYETEPLDFSALAATTLVLGDGDPTNGDAGQFGSPRGDDTVPANVALKWESHERFDNLPEVVNHRVPYPRGNELRYDARDRLIAVGGPVSVTHTIFPAETLNIGGAFNLYPSELLGDDTSYIIPIGNEIFDGTNGYYAPFEEVFLQLQSHADGVTVSVDNGSDPPAVFQLDRGDLWGNDGATRHQAINSSATADPAVPIRSGTQVTASGPVTALLVTGRHAADVAVGQSRLFSLLPAPLFGNDYVLPVYGTSSRTQNVYLYNPHASDLDVAVVDNQGSGTVRIPAGGIVSYGHPVSGSAPGGMGRVVPPASSARLTAPRSFWGLAAIDYLGFCSDWGYGLVPMSRLTADVSMGWAPGNGFTPTADRLNSAPIWVSPIMDGTIVRVDLDGDGAFDLFDTSGDGSIDDPGSDTPTDPDNGYRIDTGQVLRIYDEKPTTTFPGGDHDQTGARVVASNRFVAAFGQDNEVAECGGSSQNNHAPLDLGYEVLPHDENSLVPVLEVEVTTDRHILLPSTTAVTFTGVVRAFAAGPLTEIDLQHVMPDGFAYRPGSSWVDHPDTGPYLPDEPTESSAGGKTTWTWTLDEVLQAGQVMEVGFVADVTAPGDRTEHVTSARAVLAGVTLYPRDTVVLVRGDLDVSLNVVNVTQGTDTARAGDVLDFTVTVDNAGVADINGVVARIPMPSLTQLVDSHGGTFEDGCNCIRYDIGLLAAGASVVNTLTVAVIADATPGDRAWTQARVTSDDTPEMLSLAAGLPISSPVLDTEILAATQAFTGQTLTYEVRVANTGTETMTGGQLTVDVPTGTTYDPESLDVVFPGSAGAHLTDAVDGDAGSCDGSVVQLVLPATAPAEQVVLTFRVVVTATEGSTITATASAEPTELPGILATGVAHTLVNNTGDTDGDGLTDVYEVNSSETDPYDADTDDDGILDGWELDPALPSQRPSASDPLVPDTDGDGVLDGTEVGVVTAGPDTDLAAGNFRSDLDPSTTTDPALPDTDGGGVSDGAEDNQGAPNGRVDAGETDPNVWGDEDADADGLANATEDLDGDQAWTLGEPDWQDPDTDEDGVRDGEELPAFDADSDGDGAINAVEFDSDGDGLSDGLEIGITAARPGTETPPFVADLDPSTTTDPTLADTDGGGVSDGDEESQGAPNGRVDVGETDPNVWGDEDPDADGLANATEDLNGDQAWTPGEPNWQDPDTDDDGVRDGEELPAFDADSDGDGAINAVELDSDGDGLTDGVEVGITWARPGTETPPFVADSNGLSDSNMDDANSDDDCLDDGEEDADHDGQRDAGETDPTDPDSDDDTALDGSTAECDCAPLDPQVSPLAAEVCGDGIDNDCDGAADEADDDCEPDPCSDGSCGVPNPEGGCSCASSTTGTGWALLALLAAYTRWRKIG